MRIGIYTKTAHPAGGALEQGFAGRAQRIEHRDPRFYRGETESFDLVIVAGMKAGAAVVQTYAATAVPVVVFDFGYLDRVNVPDEYETGHFQFGMGGLNRPPEFECPPDRFDALGLDIAESGGDPDGYVLLCGQVPGDAAHGMNPQDHRAWLRSAADRYGSIVYRSHPHGGIALPGERVDYSPLDDALAGARLVVTYNSNVGHDALLAGVPVVCGGPSAYADLAGTELPPLEARRDYFNRLAYGQWTLEEMRSGECQAFLLGHLVPNLPFEAAGSARDPAAEEIPGVVVDSATAGTGQGIQVGTFLPPVAGSRRRKRVAA